MKKMFLTVMFFVSSNAIAGWYDNVTLSYVYAGTSGGGRISVGIENETNVGGCGGSELVFTDLTEPTFGAMYSALLAARTAGKPISVYTTGPCVGPGRAPLSDVRF